MRETRSARSAIVTEIVVYAASALISFALLGNLLKKLDPNAQNSKQAKAKRKEIAGRLGRPLLECNQYEDIIAMDVVNPDHIKVTFDSIGGLDDIKQALHELVILPLVRPELFAKGKLLKPVKGVLLYGPPGTGKTMLAKALAKESNACFINVRAATLQSKWFGDAQKLVTAVFTLAWKIQPCIIFIDEIDSFLGTRKSSDHDAVTSMKTEFMSLWDGFLTDNDARVMVLAATNRPWEVDEAILRRLPRAFEVNLADARQREEILSVVLGNEHVDETLRRGAPRSQLGALAAKLEGYSGSDMQDLCKQAALLPIHDFIEEERRRGFVPEGPRPLTADDILYVLESNPPAAEAAQKYRGEVARSKHAQEMAAQGGIGGMGGGADLTALLTSLLRAGMVQGQGQGNGRAAPGNHDGPAPAPAQPPPPQPQPQPQPRRDEHRSPSHGAASTSKGAAAPEPAPRRERERERDKAAHSGARANGREPPQHDIYSPQAAPLGGLSPLPPPHSSSRRDKAAASASGGTPASASASASTSAARRERDEVYLAAHASSGGVSGRSGAGAGDLSRGSGGSPSLARGSGSGLARGSGARGNDRWGPGVGIDGLLRSDDDDEEYGAEEVEEEEGLVAAVGEDDGLMHDALDEPLVTLEEYEAAMRAKRQGNHY